MAGPGTDRDAHTLRSGFRIPLNAGLQAARPADSSWHLDPISLLLPPCTGLCAQTSPGPPVLCQGRRTGRGLRWLRQSCLKGSFPRPVEALVSSADFPEGATESARRVDWLVPPLLCQPRASHLPYRSLQKADPVPAEIRALMGAASYRQALTGTRGDRAPLGLPLQRHRQADERHLLASPARRPGRDTAGNPDWAGITGASYSF